MPERFYSGRQDGVMLREGDQWKPLDLRLDLDRDGESQFKWGRQTRLGNRLSVALLADALGDDKIAIDLAEAFTTRVVVMLPERWTMSRARVLSFVEIIGREALDKVSLRRQVASSSRSIESSNGTGTRRTTKSEYTIGER
jgi:hypothetical protein